MGSYVKSVLTEGENLIYEGRQSWLAELLPIFLGLLTLPLFGIGLMFLVPVLVRHFTTELAITDRRVIAKFGLISRKTVEISVRKIESVQVVQGVLGRLLNYGSVIVAGAGNPQAPITNISNPMAFRQAFVKTQGLS